MRTQDLDYHMPPELIATEPAARRDDARLLVAPRDGGEAAHRTIADLPELLNEGDLLVFNTSKVVQARLLGVREDTGGKVQMLYLRGSGQRWEGFVRTKRVRPGIAVLIDPVSHSEGSASPEPSRVELIEPLPEASGEGGAWRVRSTVPIEALLDLAGRPPLPPYILSARRHAGTDEDRPTDRERYQTVYAQQPGSVAAPTAGLHLSQPLLDRLREGGVGTASVVLHVGSGTFRPVEADRLEDHPMHAETCIVPEATEDAIRSCRSRGGRVLAVGTTTARALEALAHTPGAHAGTPMDTSIMIAPGHEWRSVDGLLTNFHLPRSTLLAMVASLFCSTDDPPLGVARLLKLYEEAIDRRYRFYSYGDAMLVAPHPPERSS